MLADVGHIVVVDDDAALQQMVTRYFGGAQCPDQVGIQQKRVEPPFSRDASQYDHSGSAARSG
jgi:hypothetical protein